MSRNQEKKRFEYIDLLEFIAMSIVLINHCTTYRYDIMESNSASTYLNYFFRSLHSAAVPLFFFANGYLLFNRSFSLKKHIFKTLRIIALTIVWGFINVLSMMVIDRQLLSLKEVLIAVWTWKQGWINQFWFMGVLVCIYILFPILKCAFDADKKIFSYFVAVCALMTFGNKVICAAGTIAAHELFGYPEQILDNVFNIFNPFRGVYLWYSFVYFCCGGLAHLAVPYILDHRKKLNIAASAALLASTTLLTAWAIYLTVLAGELWDNVWGGQDTVFTFIIVISAFILSLNYNPQEHWGKKVVYLVSANTLGIFFIHEIYIHLILPLAREVPVMQNIFGSIVLAAVIMALCLATTAIIKRIPIIKKLLT